MNRMMMWMCPTLVMVALLSGCERINPTSTGPESPAAMEKVNSSTQLSAETEGNVALILKNLRGDPIPATEVMVRVLVNSRFAGSFSGSSYGIRLPVPFTAGDLDGNAAVDFDDFFIFADHFGLAEGTDGFDPRYDFDDSGEINFDDF
ncbi:MAG: hypothetical protein Q8L21_00960, partial [Candidatus Komeilibacteria bacterium]|nr:hypothetical protein [Candidatus Komeilibacteria bacterium]